MKKLFYLIIHFKTSFLVNSQHMSLSVSDCNFIMFPLTVSFVVGAVMSTAQMPLPEWRIIFHPPHLLVARLAIRRQLSAVSLVCGCLCWSQVPHPRSCLLSGADWSVWEQRGHTHWPQLGTTLKHDFSIRTLQEVDLGPDHNSTFPFAQSCFISLPSTCIDPKYPKDAFISVLYATLHLRDCFLWNTFKTESRPLRYAADSQLISLRESGTSLMFRCALFNSLRIPFSMHTEVEFVQNWWQCIFPLLIRDHKISVDQMKTIFM